MTTTVQVEERATIKASARLRGIAFFMIQKDLEALAADRLAVSRIANPSGLRQAKLTNNVISRAFVGQSNSSKVGHSDLSACKLLHARAIQVCAAKVNDGREHGTRLAFYWAVPRQGYKKKLEGMFSRRDKQ
jgi:hypothetical protein